MKQKFWEFDWDALIKREPDIDKTCIGLPISFTIYSFNFHLY
jgi:hypothetical protein